MENKKNCWVIPTDKPSRLLQSLKVIELLDKEWLSPIGNVNRNIYITSSDEEIKEGDWFYNPATEEVLYASKEMLSWNCDTTQEHKGWKKIILTTDQDLIADGVQAIDDEFIEWFVKNPSCEEVEVANSLVRISSFDWRTDYRIIIPKEEPKQRLEKYSERFDNDKSPIGNPETWGKRMVEEPKQETIKIACVQCCGTGEIQKSTNRKQSNFECDLCNGRGHWNKIIEPKQEVKTGTISEAIKQVITNQLQQETLEDKIFQQKLVDELKSGKLLYQDASIYTIILELVQSNGKDGKDEIFRIFNEVTKEEPDYTALLQPVGTKQESFVERMKPLQEQWQQDMDKELMKQETLEEAAERLIKLNRQDAFIEGAKWQQQNSYSEEEVNEIIAESWNSCEDNEGETFTEARKRILKQFKKK